MVVVILEFCLFMLSIIVVEVVVIVLLKLMLSSIRLVSCVLVVVW